MLGSRPSWMNYNWGALCDTWTIVNLRILSLRVKVFIHLMILIWLAIHFIQIILLVFCYQLIMIVLEWLHFSLTATIMIVVVLNYLRIVRYVNTGFKRNKSWSHKLEINIVIFTGSSCRYILKYYIQRKQCINQYFNCFKNNQWKNYSVIQ